MRLALTEPIPDASHRVHLLANAFVQKGGSLDTIHFARFHDEPAAGLLQLLRMHDWLCMPQEAVGSAAGARCDAPGADPTTRSRLISRNLSRTFV